MKNPTASARFEPANTMLSLSDKSADGRISDKVINWKERRKDVIMRKWKELPWHFLGGNEENHKKPHLEDHWWAEMV
jgi:hypothetical protein